MHACEDEDERTHYFIKRQKHQRNRQINNNKGHSFEAKLTVYHGYTKFRKWQVRILAVDTKPAFKSIGLSKRAMIVRTHIMTIIIFSQTIICHRVDCFTLHSILCFDENFP